MELICRQNGSAIPKGSRADWGVRWESVVWAYWFGARVKSPTIFRLFVRILNVVLMPTFEDLGDVLWCGFIVSAPAVEKCACFIVFCFVCCVLKTLLLCLINTSSDFLALFSGLVFSCLANQ